MSARRFWRTFPILINRGRGDRVSAICGWVEPGSRVDGSPSPELVAGLDAMLQAGRQRGPDGRSRWMEARAALGHLALHVTPESPFENHPLVDEEAGLVLVADARLDNRKELVDRLHPPLDLDGREVPGGDGLAISDTALLLAAYRRWGTECPARLIGDFAFAVWDVRRRRLFAARDPMGIRSFYFRRESRRLLFATEIQQVLAVVGVPTRIFEPAAGAFLVGGLERPEWTFYAGIEQLPPGQAILVADEGLRRWRFWNIDPSERIRYRHADDYTREFRQVLDSAVQARLRSRSGSGILLSGGVDSGGIAVAASRALRKEQKPPGVSLRAYSHAFDELADSDERHVSEPLARHLGIPVTDVPCDDTWPLKDFPLHGPHPDDPWMEVYQVMNARMYRTVADDARDVVVAGYRGDEVVGDWILDVPGLLLSGRAGRALRELAAYRTQGRGSVVRFAQREVLAPLFGRPPPPVPPSWTPPSWLTDRVRGQIDLPALLRARAPEPPMDGPRGERYSRIFRYGGARAAVHERRAAAGFGLEYVDPWADVRIARFVLGIPQHLVNRVSEPKRIAIEAMRQELPPDLLGSFVKMAPSSLFLRGFRERERETVRDLFRDPLGTALGLYDRAAALDAFERFLQGLPTPHNFWWPLSLELWLRCHWS